LPLGIFGEVTESTIHRLLQFSAIVGQKKQIRSRNIRKIREQVGCRSSRDYV